MIKSFIHKGLEAFFRTSLGVGMARMHNPAHPGLVLKEDVLPELGITVTEAATQLGVSRVALSRVVNGRAAISADLAIRLSKWLGGRAETWLQAQIQYDLWHAERKASFTVKPFKRLATA
jgi:addiction module HigA family antidote